jgi:DNA-binding NarL/FixJ family response regulator
MARRSVGKRRNRRVAPDGKPDYLLPDNPAENLFSAEDWVLLGSTFHLTAFELDVMILTLEGRTRRSIARKLKRSASAVRQRIDALYRKLNVTHVVGLAIRVMRVYLTLRS